jgi:hypothetical protein
LTPVIARLVVEVRLVARQPEVFARSLEPEEAGGGARAMLTVP